MTRPETPDPEAANEQRAPAVDAAPVPDVPELDVPEAPHVTEGVKLMTPDEDSVQEDRRAGDLTQGSTTAAPPWQRAGTTASDGESPTARLQVAAPKHRLGAEGTKTETKTDQQRPVGRAYGFPSETAKGAGTGATRYGRSVAQPLSSQSSRGRGQDFSQPTVRIGGRVQSEPVAPQPSVSTRVRPTRLPRRASLQLRYLEPWSVLKVSLVLSVAGFLAWMVAVGVLYSVLAGMGVWDQLNGTYSDLTSVNEQGGGQELISAGGVFGVAALVGLVNIVLITAMCTVGAFIYNASADLAGGIEVTLSERD